MIESARVRVVGLDADDTLWANEMIFRDAESAVAELLADYEVEHVLKREMYAIEGANLPAYGYGIKGFVLSMIELACRVSGGRVGADVIAKIIDIGRGMLREPVVVLDGVRSALEALAPRFRLVVITKGDLLDQERKLERSGLARYFHHVEVVSDKSTEAYRKTLRRMDVQPEEFLMVGNSLKSDVLPLLPLGCQAVHVPYHVTWEHERAEPADSDVFATLDSISELPGLLG